MTRIGHRCDDLRGWGTQIRWSIGVAALLIAGLVSSPALAGEVFVLGNTQSGHVVIRGNSVDAADQANIAAKAIRPAGWTLLFADDAPGWGAVVCVHHAKGFTFFPATGQPSEVDAIKLSQAAAQKFVATVGGSLVLLCAPHWNNRGDPIAFGSAGLESMTAAQPEKAVVDRAISAAKGMVYRQVSHSQEDYNRYCVAPRPSAKAELAPIGNGVVRRIDKRPPPKIWRAADWCPKHEPSATVGIRN